MKKRKKKKKVRIKFRVVLFFLFILGFIGLCVGGVINIPISNIYIKGNIYLTDQEVIEIAKIENYPSTFKNFSSQLEKRLEKSIYIKEAIVKKKWFTQVYIDIIENKPLFFNQSINQTVLLNKKTIDKKYNVPTLINYIPDVIYDEFIEELSKIDDDVLTKVSEIKYDPDEVDDSRFLLTMSDSNYVYINLDKFKNLNNYNDIVKQFDNKKGILYLNSGGYFEIAK
ncbi:MAG: FtsQ-type POTRA domain-containing protein [Firmicutes bacterium]|nr:FtsQ-type POTRA domain-containing protein [Bacillota bacterium]